MPCQPTWLAIGLCSLLALAPTSGNALTSDLSGRVETTDGKPVPHVEVRMEGLGGDLSTDSGEFRVRLPSHFKLGDPIALVVQAWQVVSHSDGSLFIPSDRDPIVVIDAGKPNLGEFERERQYRTVPRGQITVTSPSSAGQTGRRWVSRLIQQNPTLLLGILLVALSLLLFSTRLILVLLQLDVRPIKDIAPLFYLTSFGRWKLFHGYRHELQKDTEIADNARHYVDLPYEWSGTDDAPPNSKLSERIQRSVVTRAIVVLADGGRGKTTLCHYLALRAAQGYLTRGGRRIEPVIIDGLAYTGDFIGTITDSLKQHHAYVNTAIVESQLSLGNLLVILDGFSEIREAFRKEADSSDVPAFVRKYPDVPFIFTSRSPLPAPLEQALRNPTMVSLKDVDDSTLSDFLAQYLINGLREVDAVTRQLNEALPNLPRIPLMLRLIATVYDATGKVPADQTSLFEKYVQQLTRPEVTGIDEPAGLDFALRHLVHETFLTSGGDRGLTVDRGVALLGSIKDTLQDYGVALKPIELLNLFRRAGLYRRTGDYLRFFHDSFESYFGARALAADFREKKYELLRETARHERLNETWTFLRAILHEPQDARILDEVIGGTQAWNPNFVSNYGWDWLPGSRSPAVPTERGQPQVSAGTRITANTDAPPLVTASSAEARQSDAVPQNSSAWWEIHHLFGNRQRQVGASSATRTLVSIRPFSASAYAVIALSGLAIGIRLLLFYVYRVPKVSESGLQDKALYLLLIPWALAWAAFLFGAMRCYSRLTHRRLGNALELGGPLVLFCLVIVGGFKLVPPPPDLSPPPETLTVPPNSDKAVDLRQNVVKVSAGDSEGGFGFIIAQQGQRIFLVTAYHVVGETDTPGSPTGSIKITFFADQVENFDAKLLEYDNSRDLALLVATVPQNFNWEKQCLASPQELKRGTPVWVVGRNGDWYVPGRNGVISSDQPDPDSFLTADMPGPWPGSSGGPLVTSTGIVGMVTAQGAEEARVLSIDSIRTIVERRGYPWGLSSNPPRYR